MSSQAAVAPASMLVTIPKPPSLFQRCWPPAFIIFGLAATAAWVSILGYGLAILIAHAAAIVAA